MPHTTSASRSYTVAITLTTTLTTDRATYSSRGSVQIAGQLSNYGVAVAGIPVTFTLARPGGSTRTLTATSGSDGYARSTYKTGKSKAAIGQYTLRAVATSGSSTATASTGFSVL